MANSKQKTAPNFLKKGYTLDQLNKLNVNTLGEVLGIEFVEIGDDFISAKMPVDARTHQPHGILHGGASVALAETVGSVAATLCINLETQYCVGLDINANHVKTIRNGFVTGTARPIHIGKRTHVWEVKIVNEESDLVCISRLTMAVIDRR